MPFMFPTTTPYALGLLSVVLRNAGVEVDTLPGALLYPRTPLWESTYGRRFLSHYAGLLFGVLLGERDDVDAFVDAIHADYLDAVTSDGILSFAADPDDPGRLELRMADGPISLPIVSRAEVAAELDHVATCFARCEARATARRYDVVGFSTTFYCQLPASVALATRLKDRDPGLRVVFGGAACVGAQAEGILRSFPAVDAVADGEADHTIAPLVRALTGERALDTVPGLVYRGERGAIRRTEPAPLVHDLDALPIPDYDDFFALHAESDWADEPAELSFETSRGCWYGQRRPCTFCGQTRGQLTFRSKSDDRVYDEITTLHRRYAEHSGPLHPTDDVVDPRYFQKLFPRLARRIDAGAAPIPLFFEVRPHLRLRQLLLLAFAGVRSIQPGIETFQDDILKVMNKGARGVSQIRLLKWAQQVGLGVVYNLMIRNPGETAAACRELRDLLPLLRHLPPPASVTLTELERSSAYFRDPAAHGITNLRPRAYYRTVYPAKEADLEALAYRFDYDHPLRDDAEMTGLYREIVEHFVRWSRDWEPFQRYWADRGSFVALVDVPGDRRELHAGVAGELFRQIDDHRDWAALRDRFPALEAPFLRAQLAVWRHRGVAVGTADDVHMHLLPRHYLRRPVLADVLEAAP